MGRTFAYLSLRSRFWFKICRMKKYFNLKKLIFTHCLINCWGRFIVASIPVKLSLFIKVISWKKENSRKIKQVIFTHGKCRIISYLFVSVIRWLRISQLKSSSKFSTCNCIALHWSWVFFKFLCCYWPRIVFHLI